ncbi:hypothetical protein Tco_0093224 [Tanacetum coccineum]
MSSYTKLTKDEECESVDSTMYRGIIGSLLYLTASRPDIMFSVCLCARFQEAPKTSHLEAVKRIFRYIKVTMHLGLWYPKGNGIETVAYADSDHAGDYVDRKSTSGICTFVGCCLTSWFSKKQTDLAISTTEAEYVTMPQITGFDHQKTRNIPKELLPYGMLLTILFKHVVSVFPELVIDHYLLHDRVMHPLAPHYEQKTRSDHGKKGPRESNASSSSTTLNHPSSSRPLDDTIDVNDEESFHSNSSSPSQNVSSSSNVVPKVHQNPPHESHNLNTYLFETINLQTQQRDAHREGLRSIGQALKDMMSGKRNLKLALPCFAKPSFASSSIQTMLCHSILSFPLFKSPNSHTSPPPSPSSSSSPSSSMSCSNHHFNFSRKPRMSVRQVWKHKTSTPKSSPSYQKDSPPLPPKVYFQSPSPPSYNPLRDQMINQLHNISTILDSHTNPSNAYIHVPPSPSPQPMLKLNFTHVFVIVASILDTNSTP